MLKWALVAKGWPRMSTAQKVLANHGKSFYWASIFLGRKQAEWAAQLYQFCRYVDDLADGNLASRESRLRAIYQDLERGEISAGTDTYLENFLALAQQAEIPLAAARELVAGMISDQVPAAIENQDQLLRYCHAAAGTVGVMMCKVLGCDQPRAQSYAVDLGIAMQLTNIARDVLEDAQMGRRYLPASWINVDAQQIARADSADYQIVGSAIDRLLDLADKYYTSALQGIPMIPWRARFSIAVALRIYRQIGVQLRHNNLCWWRGRTLVKRRTKVRLTAMALLDIMPRQVPQHRTELHRALTGLSGVSSH